MDMDDEEEKMRSQCAPSVFYSPAVSVREITGFYWLHMAPVSLDTREKVMWMDDLCNWFVLNLVLISELKPQYTNLHVQTLSSYYIYVKN